MKENTKILIVIGVAVLAVILLRKKTENNAEQTQLSGWGATINEWGKTGIDGIEATGRTIEGIMNQTQQNRNQQAANRRESFDQYISY